MKSKTPMTTSKPIRKMMSTIHPSTLNMATSLQQIAFPVSNEEAC
jgi:hypothetical protein